MPILGKDLSGFSGPKIGPGAVFVIMRASAGRGGDRVAVDGAQARASWSFPHREDPIMRRKTPAQAELGRGTLV